MTNHDERYLRAVSADEPPAPLDDLEAFLDASATYGESGLREELTTVDPGPREPPGLGSSKLD